jgi:hypothetical protein
MTMNVGALTVRVSSAQPTVHCTPPSRRAETGFKRRVVERARRDQALFKEIAAALSRTRNVNDSVK